MGKRRSSGTKRQGTRKTARVRKPAIDASRKKTKLSSRVDIQPTRHSTGKKHHLAGRRTKQAKREAAIKGWATRRLNTKVKELQRSIKDQASEFEAERLRLKKEAKTAKKKAKARGKEVSALREVVVMHKDVVEKLQEKEGTIVARTVSKNEFDSWWKENRSRIKSEVQLKQELKERIFVEEERAAIKNEPKADANPKDVAQYFELQFEHRFDIIVRLRKALEKGDFSKEAALIANHYDIPLREVYTIWNSPDVA